MSTVFEAAGGRAAMMRLAEAWHRNVLAHPVVSHAFSHGFSDEHTERLAAYWTESLGGPADYADRYGADESSVVRMHAGNGVHAEMDEGALACFVQALDDAQIPDDPRLRDTLTRYFAWGIDNMNAYPDVSRQVPAGRAVARWGWDGPVA